VACSGTALPLASVFSSNILTPLLVQRSPTTCLIVCDQRTKSKYGL
jgi:hypothetical protein